MGVGAFSLVLHIFDLDPVTQQLLQPTDPRGIRRFLQTNGGVRVYRDGIRVYDYGEPENDWLELDARRVNLPAERISNRLVLGAVHLDAERSAGLVEKTNREGFVESTAYVAVPQRCAVGHPSTLSPNGIATSRHCGITRRSPATRPSR